jgi:CHAD domain-containing protein
VNPDDLACLLRRARAGLVRHLRAARTGDVRGVHRARVASRRLRELLPIVDASLGRRTPDVRRDVRRVTRALGPVREMDVTRAVLADARARHDWPADVLMRVDRTCEAARAGRRHDLDVRLSRDGVADLPQRLAALDATLVASGADERAGALLASRLRRRARAMRDAIAGVGTLYVPDALHAVRIAGKKLRYSLEIGHDAAGLAAGAPLEELKTVQELLGGLHDLQVAQLWMQATATEPGVGRETIRTLTACDRALEAECRERHAVFLTGQAHLGQLVETVRREAAFGRLPHRPTRMRVGARAVAPGHAAKVVES